MTDAERITIYNTSSRIWHITVHMSDVTTRGIMNVRRVASAGGGPRGGARRARLQRATCATGVAMLRDPANFATAEQIENDATAFTKQVQKCTVRRPLVIHVGPSRCP